MWEDRLAPKFHESEDSFLNGGGDNALESAVPATMTALRRHAREGSSVVSPWTNWTVEVREDEFFAFGPGGEGFTVSHHGDWVFVAWEAPKALMPEGRLWVSDEKGLRSYRPDDGPVYDYSDHGAGEPDADPPEERRH